MRIFDCFMFYDEEAVLDIRLNSLKNSVDCFVIVESKFYLNGKKRDLKFDINYVQYPILNPPVSFLKSASEYLEPLFVFFLFPLEFLHQFLAKAS